MRAAELHKFLARHTGYSVREIDERTRWMHRAAAIQAGRGRSAPHLHQHQAVYMILSLVARRAVDAERVAQRARYLAAVLRSGIPIELQELPAEKGRPAPLWLVITRVVSDTTMDMYNFDVEGIEISEDGGTAWLLFNSGKRLLFTDNKAVVRAIKKDPEQYDKHGQTGIDRRLYIGTALLADLNFRLDDWIREARPKKEAE